MSMLVRVQIPVVTFVLKNKLPSMEGNQYETISSSIQTTQYSPL